MYKVLQTYLEEMLLTGEELNYLQDRNPHLMLQRTYLGSHASSVI